MRQTLESLKTKAEVLVHGKVNTLHAPHMEVISMHVIARDFYKLMGINYLTTPFFLQCNNGTMYIKINHIVPTGRRIQVGRQEMTMLELICSQLDEFELMKFMNNQNNNKDTKEKKCTN